MIGKEELLYNEIQKSNQLQCTVISLLDSILKELQGEANIDTKKVIQSDLAPLKALLVEANILKEEQIEENAQFIRIVEAQRVIMGVDNFNNVFNRVKKEVAKGSVRNPIGYFRKSLNDYKNS